MRYDLEAATQDLRLYRQVFLKHKKNFIILGINQLYFFNVLFLVVMDIY